MAVQLYPNNNIKTADSALTIYLRDNQDAEEAFSIVPFEHHSPESQSWIILYGSNNWPRTREVLPIRFVFVNSRRGFVTLHNNFVFRYDHRLSQQQKHKHHNRNGCSNSLQNKKQRLGERYRNMMGCDEKDGYSDPVSKVFYTYGLLHCILSYATYADLISTSTVSKFLNETSRSDSLWKEQCILLWKDKVGMPYLRKDHLIAPYWRTFLLPEVIHSMSTRDVKLFFAERPLGRQEVRDLLLANRLEKRDMQNTILQLMNDQEREFTTGFRQLWFGSFMSSMVDSRRNFILLDELLSTKGFLMNFKVIHEDDDTVFGRPEISLHYHCTCYFEEEAKNFAFRMEDPEENDMHHPEGLTWRWIVEGKALQVGMYPPLVVYRLENWGFKLENQHVVLLSQ